ncbi:hypothetical protein [Streptomyces sp. 8N706]|uniref:hypothetical protein n=1 Tax=Streptomyces sp. 8N706 TaxID=3457416 RepID=UPI003FD0A63D
MTTKASPLLLFGLAAALAVSGYLLLQSAHSTPQDADAHAPRPVEQPSRHTATSAAPAPARQRAARPPQVELPPPPGEGPAGDRVIQHLLDRSWPPDLSRADEEELLVLGRAVLRADATGTGRGQWPTYFTGKAGGHTFIGFRIQAAIARREGSERRAVVHLVWAGSDRGGDFRDGRTSTLHFTRTDPAQKGAPAWTPAL